MANKRNVDRYKKQSKKVDELVRLVEKYNRTKNKEKKKMLYEDIVKLDWEVDKVKNDRQYD